MKNLVTLSLILGSAATLFAANVTNLPPIADKPWVTNTIRTSSTIATNTPAAGYVLTSDGNTNYWAAASGGGGGGGAFTNYGAIGWYSASNTTAGYTTQYFNNNFSNITTFNRIYPSVAIGSSTNLGTLYVTNAGYYTVTYTVTALDGSSLNTLMSVVTNDVIADNYSFVHASHTGVIYSMHYQRYLFVPANTSIRLLGYETSTGHRRIYSAYFSVVR